jgi:hypothetical protein
MQTRVDSRIRSFLDRVAAAGADRTKIWSLCVNEVRSLNAVYDETTVRRRMVEYRAAARERLGPDHLALKFLRAYRKDEAEISAATREKISQRLQDLRPVDPEIVVEKGEELLRSARWEDRVAGVAIVTGRRIPEIAAHGSFVLRPAADGNAQQLVFAGAVRGDRDVASVIPCLVDPQLVVDVVAALREQKPLAGKSPTEITNNHGKEIASTIDRALGAHYTAGELRDVYATIAHAWYGTPAQSHRLFVAAALGFKPDDATTALGHIKFYLDGRERESCEDFERDRLELLAITRDKLNNPDWSPAARARIQAELEQLQSITFDTRTTGAS